MMNFRITLLAAGIFMAHQSVLAMDSLSDEGMGEVSGQDGISIGASAANLGIQRVYWQEDGKELQFRNINFANLDSTTTIDVGSDSDLASGVPAIGINVTFQPGLLLTFGAVGLCNANDTSCTTSFGEMALQLDSTPGQTTSFSFFNTNGLFDGTTSNGRLRINMKNANFYLAQTFDADGAGPTAAVRNLAILKGLTVNGTLNGKFTVDAAEGLRAQGTLSLSKTGNTNGFQFDLAQKSGVASGFTTTGAGTIIRLGASGIINNLDMRVRADNSLAGTGTQGIRFRADGVLDKNTFSLEMGHPSGHSVIFRSFADFANGAAVNPTSPDISTGDWYLNLIASGGSLPDFRAGFGGVGGVARDAIGLSVRDLSLQTYARQIVFQNNTTFTQTTQNWSIIPTLYDLDANMLLFPGGHPALAASAQRGIGFNLKMATTGRDGTGLEGTHFLIADPVAGTYMGWRNIDQQVTLGQSQFFVADAATDGVDGIKFTSNNMVIDMAGEFAVGNLPNGSTVTTIRNDDELFGLRVQLAGSMALALSPPGGSGNGYLGLSGQLNLSGGAANTVSLIEPVDGTQIQFGGLSGIINILPQHVTDADFSDASRIEVGPGTPGNIAVSFAAALEFGPGTADTDVFRVSNLNLVSGGTYRMGEIVIPGGRLYSQIDIKPQ